MKNARIICIVDSPNVIHNFLPISKWLKYQYLVTCLFDSGSTSSTLLCYLRNPFGFGPTHNFSEENILFKSNYDHFSVGVKKNCFQDGGRYYIRTVQRIQVLKLKLLKRAGLLICFPFCCQISKISKLCFLR